MSHVAYSSFLTGLIVWLKRRDSAGFYYMVFSWAVFLWGLGFAFMLNNDLPEATAVKWGLFCNVSALFIPATWFQFVLVYTGRTAKFRMTLIFVYAVTFLIFCFAFTKQFVAGFQAVVSFKHYPLPGLFYNFFTVLFFFVMVFSFLLFYRAWKTEQRVERKHDFQLLFYSSLYGFVMGGLSFVPVYGIPLPQYNLLLMPVWQIMLTYAMIRHNVFNLEELLVAAQKDKLAAIGTLAASINHEIRNPLYIVHGVSETLADNLKNDVYASKQEISDRSSEAAQTIIKQSERAMAIVKSLSDFAKTKIDFAADRNELSAERALQNVLPLLRHELEFDKIELIVSCQPDCPPICVDKRHFEQILFNLILNACQAMKRSGGKLEVIVAASGERVLIRIIDTGPGISAECAKKIFEPFYTTKESGTGLGLYITKRLIEVNGGKIKVVSKLGAGTSFQLTFPRMGALRL